MQPGECASVGTFRPPKEEGIREVKGVGGKRAFLDSSEQDANAPSGKNRNHLRSSFRVRSFFFIIFPAIDVPPEPASERAVHRVIDGVC